MENSNSNDYEKRPLINELTLAKELVHQLRFHLSPTSSSTGEILIEKILSSYDKALMMLNWNNNNNNRSETETLLPTPSVAMIESPQSAGSPRSEDSDIFYKKRKTMPRWTEQVRVCSGNGTEGPQEDGHSWRKYGQKDILGAKYPRGYYRCTHRHVQGCLATKQVQRSDEDPFVFDVTYRGKHTCNPSNSPLLQASQALCKGDQTHNPDQLLEQRKRKQSEEMLQKIRAGLTVKTENPDIREQTSSPFSFPSIMSTECIKSENNIFSPVLLDNSYMGCHSPFISPATSESNYFSPCHINSIARKQPFRTSESDLNEIVSAATSASNSLVMDLEFTLDSLDFDSNFPFHNSSFFS